MFGVAQFGWIEFGLILSTVAASVVPVSPLILFNDSARTDNPLTGILAWSLKLLTQE